MSGIVILVPTYNSASTVRATIDSIQRQGAALERVQAVYIADDGSTDATLDIIREAWHTSLPLRILVAPRNRGEYTNVNEAVSQFPPDVEWFLNLHSDNVAKENWLQVLTDNCLQVPANFASVCGSYDDWFLDGTIRPGEDLPQAAPRNFAGTTEAVRNTLINGCWWHNSASAIRVSAFKAVGGLPTGQLRLKGDWDLLLRWLLAGWGIRYVPRTLMLYRENEVGVSSLSFARHGDIPEILKVVRWYRPALSRADFLRLHLAALETVARRSARSIITRNPQRLAALAPITAGVFRSLARSWSTPEARPPLPLFPGKPA